MKNVLFVSSRPDDVQALFHRTRCAWNVSGLCDVADSPRAIAENRFDLVVFDIALSTCYAPDLLSRIASVPNHPPIVILSREFSFAFLRHARSVGASGYFTVPYAASSLVCAMDRLLSSATLSARARDDEDDDLEPLLRGSSDAMVALRESILSLRERTEPVLIYGETGSGKDVVARCLHRTSRVASGPYVACNVSCLAPSLAESLLFGTVQGSFTGSRDAPGFFEAAHGGTLFLDEIGELDLALQPKFLRVLEDKKVTRLGSTASRSVSFRLVCATNRDMDRAIADGLFRSDLFYRIDVLRLRVPPLREHTEDIPDLASSVLARYRKALSEDALGKLRSYRWPGNVRELLSCLVRASCEARSDVIYPEQIRF